MSSLSILPLIFSSPSLLSVGVWELFDTHFCCSLESHTPVYRKHHHPISAKTYFLILACWLSSAVLIQILLLTCALYECRLCCQPAFFSLSLQPRFFFLFSFSHNQCWQFNGKVKMRSPFSLTVVLVSRSDESWRSGEFTGTGSAPQKPWKTGSERRRITGGGGRLWLSDGLTACTDIKEEPENFGRCRIWWVCVNKQEEKVKLRLSL